MSFTPPRLGPGAIYLRSLDEVFRANPDLIKVAEIEPQILWTKSTKPGARPAGNSAERRFLSTLPQRVLTHGVGYPIGGTICDQTDHLPEFRLWNRELSVPWTSEHLSILHLATGSAAQSCGFLMPPIQTGPAVELAARNITQRRKALHLPFAFETGVNYFAPRTGEMSDGEFFAALAQQADCGILLDLTNLWINQKNGRSPIADILSQIPLDRVWEIHLAGVEQERGFWVDAHSREIDPDIVALTAEIIPHLPNLGAIIFELAPDRVSSFEGRAYLREIETLNRLWDKAKPAPCTTQLQAPDPQPDSGLTPEIWEQVLTERMLMQAGTEIPSFFPFIASDDERFSLYAYLAGSFRSGAIAELLSNTIRLLLPALGKGELQNLINDYVATTPPASFPTDEAFQFCRYLETHPLPIPGLKDVLAFEGALIDSAANNTTARATLTQDIETLLSALAAGRLPPTPSAQCQIILEIAVDPVPLIRILPACSAAHCGSLK